MSKIDVKSLAIAASNACNAVAYVNGDEPGFLDLFASFVLEEAAKMCDRRGECGQCCAERIRELKPVQS